MTITVARTVRDLEPHAAAWEELGATAADPNPFYEPYALCSALALLPPAAGLEIVMIWASHHLPRQPAILVGLFPLVRHAWYRGLPLRALSTWKHLYAYLGTPLVRGDRAAETLDAFLGWLRHDSGVALFEWQTIRSDSAFRHALGDALSRHGLESFQAETHTRAGFRSTATAEAYLDQALPGKKRKELRRQARRLAELGRVTYHELTADDDPGPWIDEFVDLEARGWKGRVQSALKSDPTARQLFGDYARGAHARQRWMALALRLDGRAIAMKCNLRAGTEAVAFKIAYDEEFAQFSPGVLLEIEHIRRLQAPSAPAWTDSGAAANHPMINHLWRDRLGIETLVTPTGGPVGVLAVAALPLARLAVRTVRSTLMRGPARIGRA